MNNNIPDINGLDTRLDTLSPAGRKLFDRLYSFSMQTGAMRIPANLRPWIIQQFGSVETVTRQRIIRITNLVTGEETIFNSMRALKPSDTREKASISLDSLDMGADTFANPLQNTPEDTFGRVVGKHCVTASNIAKCDELHGLVIFKNSHPLKWGREEVADYLETAWKWAQNAHSVNRQNKYFFFCWNCLWRSGASINHGHAQMTLSRGRAYSRIESLRKDALAYRQKYDSNYFDDLFTVHKSLGLAFERDGVRVMSSLTPVKGKEVVWLAERIDRPLEDSLYDVLAAFRDNLGVTSFNLGLATPPLDRTRESWQGFPVIAWLVDRGSLHYRSSDIGSLELFAANAVGSDPFKIAASLKECFNAEKKNG